MEKIPEELKESFDLLKVNFMTVDKYVNGVKKGEFKDKPMLVDDNKFFKNYPEHPLASENRFKRIKGADQIRKFKKGFSEKTLDKIHKHLFDCCAAVRLSLLKAIMREGNQKSLNIVEELYEKEKNLDLKNIKSKSVEQYSMLTIKRFKNPHYKLHDLYLKSYLGEMENDEANGEGILYYNSNGKIIYEGEFKDGKFHGNGIYYDDDGNKLEGRFEEGEFVD